MKQLRGIKHFINIKKTTALFLAFVMLITSFVPGLQTPFSPQKAEAAGNSCANTSSSTSAPTGAKLSAKVGGVALDQAATFLANMDDITGAYYDSTLDRIVFVGKTNTSLPEFDKDDLAVAIRAVIYNKTIPSVSMEFRNPNDGNLDVVYTGGIEDTKFGKVLYDADYKLKLYIHGYDDNNNRINSVVSSYKPMVERFIDKNPPANTGGYTRWWIVPKLMTLKKDDTANSFVFDSSVMEVKTEQMAPDNSTLWNQASEEFAQDQTTHYDEYAQETPSYAEAKQLGKIVSVIKWLNDNNVPSDFNWARDYAPKYVSTPKVIPVKTTQQTYNGIPYSISGGVAYNTSNTYTADNGTSSSLKTASQNVATTKEDIHWTFVKDGQSYESVAVAADAFRTLGSYNTSSTDVAFPTAGDLSLNFTRSYSSYSGGQYRIGRGWSIFPAQLYDNKPHSPAIMATCSSSGVTHLWKFALDTAEGGHETFTFANCNGYSADESYYHSTLTATNDNTEFIATVKNQTQYIFDQNFRLKQIKDKNSNTISYTYDGLGKLTIIADSKGHQLTVNYSTVNGQTLIASVEDWTGRKVEYTYDTQGNLVTAKDPRGNITNYAYDSNFKLTSITDREGTTAVTNTYTPEAKLATQKDAANITTTYTHDDTNRLITMTDSLGRIQKTKYDDKARVLEETDPAVKIVKYTYGTEFSPLTVTDKKNNVMTYTYDGSGNVTQVKYPNNKTVDLQYDAKNRVTQVTDNRYGAQAKVTTYTYDTSGNLTSTLEDSVNNSQYTYNTEGELLTYSDPMSNLTTWTRDNFGNKLTEKNFYPDHVTTFTYNTLARLTKQTDAEGKEINYTYDANGNLLTQIDGAGTTTNVYDKENRLTKITLPNNAITNLAYNTSGSLTGVTDALTNATGYGYDAYQNMTSKQDALNRQTQYLYDQLNRRTQATTPLGKVLKWEYDANGNITKRINEDNNNTTYQYDNLNRLTQITYPNSQTVALSYDDRGNLTQMVDPSGTTTYTYDRFDRLTQVQNSLGLVKYEYDLTGKLTKITYPDNKTVNYAYDSDNTLFRVTDWNNKNTDFPRYKNGLVQMKMLPNGINGTYTYDSANRLTDLEYKKGTDTVAKFTYERNSVGNITKATETGSFFTSQQASTTYEAENATLSGPVVANNNTGYSGTGFADYVNASNDYVEWNVSVATAGTYTLSFRHANGGSGDRPLELKVNGTVNGSNLSFPATGGWTTWASVTRDVSLNAGSNTIRLTATGSSGSNVDKLTVTKVTATPTPTPTATPTPTPQQNTLSIYDESLASGWDNWSWSSTVDFANTSNPYVGTKNISWTTTGGYAALYFHKASGVDTTGYTNLTFALKASQAGQGIQVQLYDNNNNAVGTTVQLSNYGGDPVSGSYKVYTIPLSALNGSNRVINGFILQDNTGSAKPAMYVDAVGLTGNAPTPTPTNTPTPTAAPTTTSIYDEALGSGWANWSWSSTIDLQDTSHPYSGTKDLSWVVNSGYAGLYLHKTGGVDTTGYNSLTFALQASQAGQNVQVLLYDNTDTAIGTPVQLTNYGGNPVSGSYKVYTIPLSALGGTNRVVNGVLIQDNTGSAKPAMYVDKIALTSATAMMTPKEFLNKMLAWFDFRHVLSGFLSIPSAFAQTPPTEYVTTYNYDVLGRLLKGTYPNSVYEYTYDGVGNRSTSKVNGATSTYTYNVDNQLTANDSTNYTYDNRGNQITAGTKTFSYNVENKLTQLVNGGTTTQNTYDGKNNRLTQQVGTVTTQFVNDVSGNMTKVLVAKNTSTNTSNFFVQGPEVISEGDAGTTSRKYYLTDGLGNIRFTTDSSGNKLQELYFDPYGNPVGSNGSGAFQFKGEQTDQAGLYFMRARYYDPLTGRFISKDPVEGRLSDPRGHNGYDYAYDNPLNLSDPSGENPIIQKCAEALCRDGDCTNEINAVADKITGYTAHGLEQAIGRDGGKGVNPGAILNAVKDPIKVIQAVDTLGRESIKYIGDQATVVLNTAGQVVSTWATTGAGVRGQ